MWGLYHSGYRNWCIGQVDAYCCVLLFVPFGPWLSDKGCKTLKPKTARTSAQRASAHTLRTDSLLPPASAKCWLPTVGRYSQAGATASWAPSLCPQLPADPASWLAVARTLAPPPACYSLPASWLGEARIAGP